MRSRIKNQIAFRPACDGSRLEERTVMSTIPLVPVLLGGASTSPSLSNVSVAPSLSTSGTLTPAQLRQNFTNVYTTAIHDLGTYLRRQAAALYENGFPTSQQINDYRSLIQGAVDATAYRVVSAASLLPNASSNLVPSIENSLLGTGQLQLVNRLVHITTSMYNLQSVSALDQAIGNQLATATSRAGIQTTSYFTTTPLLRLSVDPTTGQQIPLAQYIAQGIFNQYQNNLGSFAQTFPTVAASALYANGATTATQDAYNQFAQQYLNALGNSAYQLGSSLGLLGPTMSSQVTTALQPALFDTTQGSTSLFNAIAGLTNQASTYGTQATTAFRNAYPSIASSLATAINLPLQPMYTLPTGYIPSTFTGSAFTGFGGTVNGSGFNNGFTTTGGYPGFGTAIPTSFPIYFSTGYYGLQSNVNPVNGFTLPSLTTSPVLFPPGGPGTGDIGGTGTGTGATGTGAAGNGTGTGAIVTTGTITG